MSRLYASLLALALSLAASSPAHALCGDVTGEGNKTAQDALAVLRSAVGQPVALTCACEGCTAQCGDGLVEGDEECDSSNLNDRNCSDLELGGGQLSCDACSFDTSQCTGSLSYSLPPNYGSISLTAGFVPDPASVGVTSGGSVDAGYLGGCSGHVTAAPDFRVYYTSGGATMLRFYFIGSGDAQMIINDPSTRYSCANDTHATVHPTIEFQQPSGGAYDIWIGSAPDEFISGTLYITEIGSSHP